MLAWLFLSRSAALSLQAQFRALHHRLDVLERRLALRSEEREVLVAARAVRRDYEGGRPMSPSVAVERLCAALWGLDRVQKEQRHAG